MAAGPRDYFLDKLSKWEYDIPYTTQWVVHISPKSGVSNFLNNINSTIRVDHSQFVIDSEIMNILFSKDVQGREDGLGLYFAQSVETPREGFGINSLALGDGSGGFIAGLVGAQRLTQEQRSINIDFLETNLDFIDGIIRPWIITASYSGLIELDYTSSIKANIDIIQYTKGQNRPIRKIHSFLGCVPYEVQNNKLDYDQEKTSVRTVGWIYNHYNYKLVDGQETGIPIGSFLQRSINISTQLPVAIPPARAIDQDTVTPVRIPNPAIGE